MYCNCNATAKSLVARWPQGLPDRVALFQFLHVSGNAFALARQKAFYCIRKGRVRQPARTRYKIDSYQQTYFVINSFQELFDKTAPDFTPIYQRLRGLPDIVAGARPAEEEVVQH